MLDGKTSTTIPITLGENHVYLDVMLNGKGPYHFIFDTGGANIVDPAVAKEIGAFGSGSAQGSGVGSQTEGFSFANVAKAASWRRHAHRSTLRRRADAQGLRRFGGPSGRRIDRLGSSRALHHDVRLRRQNGGAEPAAAPRRRPQTAHVLPFVFYGTQPQIACTIDGIPAECTIDTGARDTISFMAPFIAAHPQIVPATLTAAGRQRIRLWRPSCWAARARCIGRHRRFHADEPHRRLLDADGRARSRRRSSAANIGGNLLRRFTVTFDYATAR